MKYVAFFATGIVFYFFLRNKASIGFKNCGGVRSTIFNIVPLLSGNDYKVKRQGYLSVSHLTIHLQVRNHIIPAAISNTASMHTSTVGGIKHARSMLIPAAHTPSPRILPLLFLLIPFPSPFRCGFHAHIYVYCIICKPTRYVTNSRKNPDTKR